MLLCLYFKLGFAEIKLTKNVEQNWWRKQFEGKEDRSNEARIILHVFVCIAGKGLGGGIVLTNAYQKSCRNCWKVFCLIHTWWPSAFLGSVFFLGGWGCPIQTPLNSNNMWLNMSLGLQQPQDFVLSNKCLSHLIMFWKVPFVGNNQPRGPEALSHTYKKQKHLEDGCLHCGYGTWLKDGTGKSIWNRNNPMIWGPEITGKTL